MNHNDRRFLDRTLCWAELLHIHLTPDDMTALAIIDVLATGVEEGPDSRDFGMCDGAGHDVGVFSDRRCKGRSKNTKIHGG